MAITRRSLADTYSEHDAIIEAAQAAKREATQAYRAQLDEQGMDRDNIKAEIEGFKLAYRRKVAIEKKGEDVVEHRDAIADEIFLEITTNAPRATHAIASIVPDHDHSSDVRNMVPEHDAETGEIIETNSTPDSPIGEEAGEAETGETLSASPAVNQAEAPNQSTEQPTPAAEVTTPDANTHGQTGTADPSGLAAKDPASAKAVAKKVGQSEQEAAVELPVDAISQPVSEAPSLASADRSGGHLAPSSSLQAVSAPVTPPTDPVEADRTKAHPWCRDPGDCGVHGSWNFMCGKCLSLKGERQAVEAVQ